MSCALKNVLYLHDTPTNAHLHVLVHHISTERLYRIYLGGKLIFLLIVVIWSVMLYC